MSRERIAYNPVSYLNIDQPEVGVSYFDSPQQETGISYIDSIESENTGLSYIPSIQQDNELTYIQEDIKRWLACTFLCGDFSEFYDRTAVTELMGLTSIPTYPANSLSDFSQTDGDGTLVWTIAVGNTHVTMSGSGSKSKYLYVPFDAAANVPYELHFTGASSSVTVQVTFGFLDENFSVIGSSTVSMVSGSKVLSVTPSRNATYAYMQIGISLPSSPTFTFTAESFFIASHSYVGLRHLTFPDLNYGDKIYISDTDYEGTYFVSAKYGYVFGVDPLGFLISLTKFGPPVTFIDDVRVLYKAYSK